MFCDPKPLFCKNPTTVVLVLYNEQVDDAFSVMKAANELALSFSHIQNGVITLIKEHFHF